MKKRGFTLAEVLITLVIIGIIAAMTIPTLMNKTNEQETVVAVKKAYSTLSQAWQRFVVDYGEISPSYFGETYDEATKNFGDVFVKYLNTQKICGQSTDGDCWSTENGGEYKFFDGSDWVKWNTYAVSTLDYYKIRLSDGMSLSLRFFHSYVEAGTVEPLNFATGEGYIDINGDKGPNILGKDVFGFWFTKFGVLPFGTPNELSSSNANFLTCKTTGRGCMAWVVTKGNMDYLRKDVSW